jgi:hypothetical protein
MKHAKLYYVANRGRVAKVASVESHPDNLRANLDAWQRELTPAGNDPETTTVAVVLDGQYVAHTGPLDSYRTAALRRAGVNFPGKPSTERMQQH